MNGLEVGVSLQTETEEEKYYSSQYNNWKIFSEGSVSLIVPANNGTDNYGYTDVTHSLGYVPAVETSVSVSGENMIIPGPDQSFNYTFDFYIDSGKVRFTGVDSSFVGGTTVTINYRIFYERIDQ
jgi:hypothetical protein